MALTACPLQHVSANWVQMRSSTFEPQFDQSASLIYMQRDAISAGSTLLMFGLLVVFVTKPVIEQVVRLKEQTVAIELAEPLPLPAPMPDQVAPTPIPPPPVSVSKPVAAPPPTVVPKASTPTVTPTSTPSIAKATAPVEESVSKASAVVTAEPVQQVKPTSAVIAAPIELAPPMTPAVPATPPVPSSKGQSDRYEAQVLRYLESVKRYPTSREARQTRPSGVVTVWFELSRAGKVLDAGIEKSSNSSLLDSEALKTVRSGNFPVFPEAVFANADKHRFSANLNYELKTSD